MGIKIKLPIVENVNPPIVESDNLENIIPCDLRKRNGINAIIVVKEVIMTGLTLCELLSAILSKFCFFPFERWSIKTIPSFTAMPEKSITPTKALESKLVFVR